MKLKKSCLNFKWAVMGMCLMLLAGCATQAPRPLPAPEEPMVKQSLPPEEAEKPLPKTAEKPLKKEPRLLQKETPPELPVKKQSPMVLAALTLLDQGQAHLKNRKPDEAIRVLERAVNLHPQNGENYYYLADAWLMKGNAAQAYEFNQLAGLHMKNTPGWISRINSQKDRISRLK